MPDDRDWSWLNRPAPPPPPPAAEHPLWMLEKVGRRAAFSVRATDNGPEVRLTVDGDLFWSQLLRPVTEDALREVADRKRADFVAKGWAPA